MTHDQVMGQAMIRIRTLTGRRHNKIAALSEIIELAQNALEAPEGRVSAPPRPPVPPQPQREEAGGYDRMDDGGLDREE